jgi:membrane protein DedA with SNARE-associated domain
MSLAALIATYGYAAVGIGAFIEGETFVVLGGLAAHRGYLELPWVMLSAGTGAVVGDQLFYYLGRYKGRSALEKLPRWKSKSEKVFLLLERNQIWFILAFRFMYGFRTVTPLIIGVSNIPRSRFLILDILGASIWAAVIGFSGYLFGSALQELFGDIRKYEILAFGFLAAIGLIVWIYHFVKKS